MLTFSKMESFQEDQNFLSECLDSLALYRTLILEHSTGPDRDRGLAHVESLVKDYAQIDFALQTNEKALKKVAETCRKDSDSLNEVNIDHLFETVKQTLSNKNPQPDFTNPDELRRTKSWKHVITGDTNEDVEAVEMNEPVDDNLEYEETQQGDGSVMCANKFSLPVDPITKGIVKNPMKNRRCGHIYDNDSILQYIRSMKNKAKCPFIGCSNRNLAVSDLVADDGLKSQMDEFARTQDNESESDDS